MNRTPAKSQAAESLPAPEPGHVIAIALMCGAVSVFGMLDASAKYLAEIYAVPVAQVVWVRFVANAILTLALFWLFIPPVRRGRSVKPLHQWGRSALLAVTTGFNFMAVKYLQLDQTVTIFFLSPLLVAALAGPILGEWVGWRRLLAILTGFLGVLLVMRPGFGGIHWAVVFSFGATTCYALYGIYTRYLSGHDSAYVNLYYTPLAGSLLAAPFALPAWVWPQDAFTWVLFGVMGITSTLGHWLLILAFKNAPAPVVAPFVYFGLITMVVLGYAIFGDVPTLWTLGGGAVVIGSGLYLLYRERQVK